MSSYFDKASSEVANAARDIKDDAEFIEAVKTIENRVVHDCLLNSGDREFPDDLRQKIVSHVAIHTLGYEEFKPREETVEYVKAVRSSRLINQLHEDFHDVARRRIEARFGRWSDNPENNLARRDNHVKESGHADS